MLAFFAAALPGYAASYHIKIRGNGLFWGLLALLIGIGATYGGIWLYVQVILMTDTFATLIEAVGRPAAESMLSDQLIKVFLPALLMPALGVWSATKKQRQRTRTSEAKERLKNLPLSA